jgi:hypothetical protein
LYKFADADAEAPGLKVNGVPAAVVLEKGYARITREWKKGDVVELALPMPARRVVADEAVKDDAGKVAIVRGPLVYCAEWPDNDGRVLGRSLADGVPLTMEPRLDLLDGLTVVKAGELVLIPYYAWAHRGPGEMAVWLPK